MVYFRELITEANFVTNTHEGLLDEGLLYYNLRSSGVGLHALYGYFYLPFFMALNPILDQNAIMEVFYNKYYRTINTGGAKFNTPDRAVIGV